MRSWLEARWYSPEPPPAALLPLAALYGAVAQRRRARLSAQAPKLPLPVIVVGNISVGGTGKTPFTIWLVQRLREWGWKPGVISRGYGGRAAVYPLRVSAQTPPGVCGDEPALIARRLQCPLAVAPDRVAAAQLLIESREVDILVADDGLQHYRLARDLEICVLDGARGLGNGALMPAGPLRELPRRLQEVDLIVVNGESGSDWGETALSMRLVSSSVLSLASGMARPLEAYAGKAVHAVAGIGNPGRFFAALRRRGVLPVEHAFPDHHDYRLADLQFGDELPVLMTEKDAVKCARFAQPHHGFIPVDAEIDAVQTARVRKLVEALKR